MGLTTVVLIFLHIYNFPLLLPSGFFPNTQLIKRVFDFLLFNCFCNFAKLILFILVIVAEVTTPSLGVGYEIGRAVELKKTILCLFRSNSDKSKSSFGYKTEFDYFVLTSIQFKLLNLPEWYFTHLIYYLYLQTQISYSFLLAFSFL